MSPGALEDITTGNVGIEITEGLPLVKWLLAILHYFSITSSCFFSVSALSSP